MKTYPCLIIRDFWKYESDNWKLISERTGTTISIWAHKKAMGVVSPQLSLVEKIFERYQSCDIPFTEGGYNLQNHWGHAKRMELTAEEMLAFKYLADQPNH